MRFRFKNGTFSIASGSQMKISNKSTFPKDVEIKIFMISVRGNDKYLDGMNFIGENGQILFEIRGKSVKEVWKTIQLDKDMHIIGVKANVCDKYIRGIGFFVWKLGMGVLLEIIWFYYKLIRLIKLPGSAEKDY